MTSLSYVRSIYNLNINTTVSWKIHALLLMVKENTFSLLLVYRLQLKLSSFVSEIILSNYGKHLNIIVIYALYTLHITQYDHALTHSYLQSNQTIVYRSRYFTDVSWICKHTITFHRQHWAFQSKLEFLLMFVCLILLRIMVLIRLILTCFGSLLYAAMFTVYSNFRPFLLSHEGNV